MKASLLVSTGKLELVDLPEPVITDPHHVKIQVKATGICGSEMHAFKGSHPFRKPPAVMGHEIAGIVAEVGHQVTKIKPGDRVFIDPQWVCGKCYACLSGNINLCSSKMVMGIKEWPGGFGEFVIAPEETVMHLPSSLNFVEGAMLEPLSVAVHASRIAKLQKEMSVLILGTGSIGSLIAACAKAEGITNLYAVDLHQHCIENAEKFFGVAKGFVLPSDTVENELLDLTKGKGFDVIFICADDPSLLPLSVRLSKLQGKICFLALMTEELLQYDGYAALRKEVSIITSYMGVHSDCVRSLDLVNSRSVDVEKIVTHCLPIASAQFGMELACTKEKNAIKVVLTHTL